MAYSLAIKQEAQNWFRTPKELRKPSTMVALMSHLKIKNVKTLHRWREELEKPSNGAADKLVDQLASLDEFQIDEFFKRVYERAMEPKATAKHMELFAKLNGLLIERKENINIDITADDIAERVNRARRELEDRRMVTVPAKPPALPS